MLTSTAGAAEHQGDKLGMFDVVGGEEHGGRPYFLQRDTKGSADTFLYKEEGNWLVSETLGGTNANLMNNQDTPLPPTDQWLYWDGEKFNDNDTSLVLESTALTRCQLVTVAGQGAVVEKQGETLGDYRSLHINIGECVGYYI